MQKKIDEKSGEFHLTLTADEFKKLKIILGAAAAIFLISVGTAIYSGYSVRSLRAENTLYQNQLKMADDKLQSLEAKTRSVEKLSSQLQQMIQANNNGAGSNISSSGSDAGGQGGASTVPDKARDVETKDGKAEDPAPASTPGELLKNMRKLDDELNNQIRLVVRLRETYLNQTSGMPVQIMNASQTTPNIWPVNGTISSNYGFRISPGGIGSTYHEGIDIAADYGEPVIATAAGTVITAGWVSGYGNLVEIRHVDGITTRYGHNSALLVSEGQKVEQGTVISLVGSTGNSTGPHCHYEVRINGDAVDPLYFLPGKNN